MTLAPQPILDTPRLRLRPLCAADFEAEAAFYASERSRFVGGPMERPAAWRTFAMFLGHWALRGFGFWGVEDRESGGYLGRVGLWEPEGWPEPELGWIVMSAAEGRGVATEAAARLRAHAFEAYGWKTLISSIKPDNHRSIRVAERLGAVYEGEEEFRPVGPLGVYRHPGPAAVAS